MATTKTPPKTPGTKAVAPPAKPAAKRVAPARPRAAAVTAVPTAAAADGVEHHEKPRIKLVRDSFTMPQLDFDLIPALKKRALAFQRPAKKSELLRAGLHALAALDNARLKKALDSLAPIKAGRPKKAG
ncbi:MAG: hypothetical protein IV105_22580 [Rhizobacter sp.]|nr:hypothetical protein [Rhizobacter sp.]